MKNLVIVALPAEDDYVNRISSEKKPHLTLLYLGDAERVQNLDTITGFVEHAASLLVRFGLSVARRGTLGPDEADVVFFDRYNRWDYKLISDFRSQLLQDDNIRTAYDSVEQYDEWQPHLTLGYPAAPAHEDRRDYPGIRYVDFDRIAIWTEDYEGVEIPLPWEHDLDVLAMSDPVMGLLAKRGVRIPSEKDTKIGEFLAHHGIRGMKWGIRRQNPSGPNPVVVSTDHSKLAGGKVKIRTSGGEGHPASPDAVRAATTKQKLKKSGKHSLSNEELQSLINRMNMEQSLSQLQGRSEAKGKQVARQILGNIAKEQVSKLARETISKQMESLLIKKR